MPDRSVNYVFKGTFTNLTAGLTAAGRNVGELGAKMTALDANGKKMRATLTQYGVAAGGVGLVAAAGLTVAIGASARFEKSMSAVQAATHESAGNMKELSDAAIQAGADTVYSATEAASAIEELAKAGVSTADILDGGLSGALNLAAAGAIEVADAAELAATAMTQFKLEGDQVNHVADLLAAGAGKAQGGVGDLGMALKQSGLVAAQTGLSIEDTTGALAQFAANGLIGSDAGTSFKTMLQSLTPTSEAAAKLMKELGIEAYDAQGNFVGLETFAGKLKAGLGKLSVEQQNATLKTIFGSDAVRAASILYKDGAEGVAKWRDNVDDAGYAAETAATRLDNLSGDFEQLKGSLGTALIGAGEGSQGPLRQLVQGLTNVVNLFNKMPGAAQGTVTALLGITAVTGGGLWFGSKVINGVVNAKNALADLGIEAGRTKGAIANIGAGAAGLTAVIASANVLQETLDKITHARLDTKNLSRDMEALADGRVTKNLDNLFHTFQDIDNGWAAKANPLSWISSWDPSGFEAAEKNVKSLDDALASMVESGHSEQAARALANLAPEAKKAGLSTKELAKLFPEYQTALDNASGSTDMAAEATGELGAAQAGAIAPTVEMTEELKKSRDAAANQAQAFFGIGASVNDAKVSLGAWIEDMRKQARALKEFTDNAETAAKRGLDDGLIASLREAGPEGALRMQQLADATDKELRAANRAWRAGERQIERYTDAVGGVPEVAATRLEVQNAAALARIDAVKQQMATIKDKSVRLDFYVNQINAGNKPKGGARGQADGGTVPKTGLPYADRHPYMLADGEEVISNRRGQADRFRPLLKAINNAADGATVGYAPAADIKAGFDQMNALRFAGAQPPPIDYARLASAVSGDRLMGFRDSRDSTLSAMRTALKELPIARQPQDPSLLYGTG